MSSYYRRNDTSNSNGKDFLSIFTCGDSNDAFSDEGPAQNGVSRRNKGNRHHHHDPETEATTQHYERGQGEPRSNDSRATTDSSVISKSQFSELQLAELKSLLPTDRSDILRSQLSEHQLAELKSLIIDEFRTDSDAALPQDHDNEDGADKYDRQSKLPVSSPSSRAEGDIFETMTDTFSIMFVCNIKSLGFAYSVFFLALQVATLLLIGVNILKDALDGNVLNVPVNASLDVVAAQVLALFISLISQSDFLATFDLMNVKYDDTVLLLFEGATRTKWIISNVCRFLVGILSIAISFILIVQSTTVIELFFNFAAVLFVSDLDNIGFRLAHRGFMIGDLEETTRKLIYQVQFQQRNMVDTPLKKMRIPVKWLRISIFVVHVLILYAAWGVVRYRQATEYYLRIVIQSGCQSVQVDFDRNAVLADFGFSDYYEMSHTHEWIGGRPVYYQRNIKNGFGGDEGYKYPGGKFSYCKSAEAWVFHIVGISVESEEYFPLLSSKGKAWFCGTSLEMLDDDNEGGDNGDNWMFNYLKSLMHDYERRNECNGTSTGTGNAWLARSPKTKAYSLVDAPTTGWTITPSTKSIIDDFLFEFSCLDCGSNTGCSYHGTCKNKRCMCDSPRTGKRCQTRLCPQIFNYELTTARASEKDLFWSFENITHHDRPIYYRDAQKMNTFDVIYYSLDRFKLDNIGYRDHEDRNNSLVALREAFTNNHESCFGIFDDLTPIFVSDIATDIYHPAMVNAWYNVSDMATPAQLEFVCY